MKKYFWGKLLLSLICFFALCLSSCSSSAPDLKLLSSSFCGEISWCFDSQEMRASFSHSPDGAASLTLITPDSLQGLTASVSSQGSSLSIGSVSISPAPELYLYILNSLDTRGGIEYVGRSTSNTQDLLCYRSSLTDRLWYFSASDGRPVRIEGEAITLEIVWIEYK